MGFSLYGEIAQANELGLPPEVFEVYSAIFQQLGKMGMTRKEFAAQYFAHFHKPLSGKRQDEILKLLNGVGLIREEQDENDKRVRKIYCSEQKLYTPSVGGTPSSSLPPSRGVYSFDDLVKVFWVEDFVTNKACGVCGDVKPTSWRAETNNNEQIPICEECALEAQKQIGEGS